MTPEELMSRLENLEPPVVSADAPPRRLKLALLNAHRSSRVGVALVAAPCLFVFLAILTHWMHWRFSVLSAVEEWMARIDRTAMWFVPPLLLVGFPLLAVAVNLLAIAHFELGRRELRVTLKLRPLNLVVILMCGAVLACVSLYVIGENRH